MINETYSYGFNGMMRSDEVAGSGNSYTAEFWQYSSRLGRRWNIDPVVKDWESGYATFRGNPIWWIDPNGDNAWKPEVGDDGTTSFIAEEGDTKETLGSQYGLDKETVDQIVGDKTITEGTKISGQDVYNATGKEVLRLDLKSPEATDQRIFDQFLFARDLTVSKGNATFQTSEFYSNRTPGLKRGLANMTVDGETFKVQFNLPLYRVQADGSSNSVSLGISAFDYNQTTGTTFNNQSNVYFPKYHPNTGARNESFNFFMEGKNDFKFIDRFERTPRRYNYFKTKLQIPTE